MVAARSADYDLTRMEDAARMFDDAGAELVFHLAAEVGGIGANRANPGRYWYANLMMGAHVLEQARLHETPKLVVVGTVCSYPKFAPIPFREDDLWNGYPEETNAPYGVAKKAVLVGAQAYREQYGLDTVFLLPANLYGPRDNFHPTNAHVIADLVRKMIEAEEEGRDEIVLWGDGSPTREFLYVEDCVDGLVLAAERYDGPEPVNLGAGKEISIRDLAGLVAEVTGYAGRITWDADEARTGSRGAASTRLELTSSSGSRRGHRSARDSSAPSPGTARRALPVSVASSSLAAARGAGRTVDQLLERPRVVLGALIGIQIAATFVLALTVTHNGWVYFQGGDQIVNTTTGWLLTTFVLAPTEIGYVWPLVQAPITLITGPTFVQALPVLVVLDVLVLGPIAILCVYGIAATIGGRLLGYWAAALWVLAPFAAIPLFVDRYHEKWVDHFLPQALGLTAMPDFPSMVLVLGAAYFVARSLSPGTVADAALAGLLAGAAGGLKPANYLFVLGAALAYPIALRWREAIVFGIALVPSLLALYFWKDRGLGYVPAISLEQTRLAAGSGRRARGHQPRPVRRPRFRALAGADGPASRVLLECASRAVGTDRRTARGPPDATMGDRRAPCRLARRVHRREGLLGAGEHRDEHVLAPAHACVASLPPPPGRDPAARADAGEAARNAHRSPSPAARSSALDRSRGRPHDRGSRRGHRGLGAAPAAVPRRDRPGAGLGHDPHPCRRGDRARDGTGR